MLLISHFFFHLPPYKCRPALLTHVRLLPRVRPLVLLHVALLTKGLPAELARVRLVPGVDPKVGLQVGPLGEALAAQLTNVRVFGLIYLGNILILMTLRPVCVELLACVVGGWVSLRDDRALLAWERLVLAVVR